MWSSKVFLAMQFPKYWALSFATLGIALWLFQLFCRWINSDLELHSARKEAVIAGIASLVQGTGFWVSALLFHGDPFHRMVIPGMIVAIIYKLGHFEEWSGYEVGGFALFQAITLGTGLCIASGQFKLAVLFLAVFGVGLAFVASIAKSL